MNPISRLRHSAHRAPSTATLPKRSQSEAPVDRFESGRVLLDAASGSLTKLASIFGGAELAATVAYKSLAATALMSGAAASLPGLAVVGGVAIVGGLAGGFVGSKVGGPMSDAFGALGEKTGEKLGLSPKWLKTGAKVAGTLAITAASSLSIPLTVGLLATAGGIGAGFAKRGSIERVLRSRAPGVEAGST